MRACRVRLKQLSALLEIAEVGEIARRYAAMNAFDGILTIIGVLMGSYSAHVRDPRVVLQTGLATAVAVGISGLWGAYLTETAERRRSLGELEQMTLSELGSTRLGRASRVAVIAVALIDGISPFLAAVVVLSPFFFAPWLLGLPRLYYLSLTMALSALAGLGAFLGTISRERLLVSVVKTVAAGLACVAVNLILGLD